VSITLTDLPKLGLETGTYKLAPSLDTPEFDRKTELTGGDDDDDGGELWWDEDELPVSVDTFLDAAIEALGSPV